MENDDNGSMEQSLKEKILDQMVYPNPEGYIYDAIKDTLEIYRNTGELRVLDGMSDRDADDQMFTYLLGAWSTHWIDKRESAICSVEQLKEDLDISDDELDGIIGHEWVQYQEGSLRMRDAYVNECAWYLVCEYV